MHTETREGVTHKWLSCADTAKLVREVLKAKFPGTKFSVRSQNYAGGASIHIGYVDGPPSREVEAACDHLRRSDFNAMIDLQESRGGTLLVDEIGEFEQIHYGADFISAQREFSDEVEAGAKARIAELAGVDHFDYNDRYDVAVDRDTGELVACTGQNVSDTYGSTILHRYLYPLYLSPAAPPVVGTYQLVAGNGRPIRKATVVTFPDGEEIRFIEKLPKRKAIEQAEARREAKS
jgi:hypothetical protein